MLLELLFTPLVTFFFLRIFRIAHHYFQARKLNIPILVSLVSREDKLWLLCRRYFWWTQHLPFGVGEWFRFSHHGWTLDDRWRIHERYGEAFVIVSPGANEIYISNGAATVAVLTKYKTWHKPLDVYKPLNVFGRNVLTVNGAEWTHHRKIIGSGFQERNCKLVWSESIVQAKGMLEQVVQRGESTIQEIAKNITIVAMHVLSAAGAGRSYAFNAGLQQLEPGHKKSYAETMSFVLQNMIRVILLMEFKIPLWLLPANFQDLNAAIMELQQYLKEFVQNEKNVSSQTNMIGAHLLSALVHANEAARSEKTMHLSDTELYGNLFLVNMAGFETTATVLTYTLALLAANRETQEWVGEEVDAIWGRDETEMPKYEDCFPRLYETLRLYSVVPDFQRCVADEPQSLLLSDREILVSPKTVLSVNINALQTDPRHWGSDTLIWKPQRWITADTSSGLERLADPPKSTVYVPWGVGPRVCPGKKFSQVEFVAVIAHLLREYRLRPARGHDAMEQEARDRLLEVVRNSQFKITPKMRRPEDASIVLERR